MLARNTKFSSDGSVIGEIDTQRQVQGVSDQPWRKFQDVNDLTNLENNHGKLFSSSPKWSRGAKVLKWFVYVGESWSHQEAVLVNTSKFLNLSCPRIKCERA